MKMASLAVAAAVQAAAVQVAVQAEVVQVAAVQAAVVQNALRHLVVAISFYARLINVVTATVLVLAHVKDRKTWNLVVGLRCITRR
jgi:hypothetical protein